MKLFIRGLCAAGAALCCAAAISQSTYPTKPIRLVVPFAAGGPSDVIARIIAPKLSEALGQSVVIDNRAGAGGTIGVGNVAHSAPDGYSLVNVGPGPIVVSPYITKTPYDPAKDLLPIGQVAEVPVAIVASPKFAPGTLARPAFHAALGHKCSNPRLRVHHCLG